MANPDIPSGWGGPLAVDANVSGSARHRSAVRSPTEHEKEWLDDIVRHLDASLQVFREKRPEFQRNLEFVREACRTLLVAYAFGEESTENVLRYTASIMLYFGMPAPWRLSVLGIMSEGIVTARRRPRVKGKRGEPMWLAFSCGALVDLHMTQGMKQGPAAKEALKLLEELGLPHTVKIDTVKRWHQEHRSSLGLEPLQRGRPIKSDIDP